MRLRIPALAFGLTVTMVSASAFAQNASVGKAAPHHQFKMTQKARPDRPDFGTADEHYVRIGGSEFATDGTAATGYTNSWFPAGLTYTWLGYFNDTGVYQHLYGWAHAPGGSSLDYVEFDYCNDDAALDLTFNLYDCDYHGECASTPVATLTGTHGDGCSSVSATSFAPLTVDNFHNEYLLEVVFPAAGPTDGTIGIAGAIVGWKYQVSPAPATATFGDVPTSDFGFQYIEALAASGITGGCGGGNYCPDATLTRRQMAIFLAKALGLDWSGY